MGDIDKTKPAKVGTNSPGGEAIGGIDKTRQMKKEAKSLGREAIPREDVMCWVAVDRGIRLAQSLGRNEKVSHWRKAAKEIHNDILNKGWNSEKEAFTQHYDTEALDASALLMPLFGFLAGIR
ncbi:glycoside hydrolase family 15 protein [Chloroflexota bacterium]